PGPAPAPAPLGMPAWMLSKGMAGGGARALRSPRAGGLLLGKTSPARARNSPARGIGGGDDGRVGEGAVLSRGSVARPLLSSSSAASSPGSPAMEGPPADVAVASTAGAAVASLSTASTASSSSSSVVA
ncbi:unnamed protein product, partial [Scytosiphon promiscuus]